MSDTTADQADQPITSSATWSWPRRFPTRPDGVLEQAPSEKPFQIAPAINGYKVSLGSVVTRSIRDLEEDHPARWMILEMLVSIESGIANTFTDVKRPATLPGEPLALWRCWEFRDANEFISHLSLKYRTHFDHPSSAPSSRTRTAPEIIRRPAGNILPGSRLWLYQPDWRKRGDRRSHVRWPRPASLACASG